MNNTTKTDTDWIHYKKYRNKLTRLIEQSKRKYFKMEIINSKGNPKKLWQTINNIINTKTTKSLNTIPAIYDSGKTI